MVQQGPVQIQPMQCPFETSFKCCNEGLTGNTRESDAGSTTSYLLDLKASSAHTSFDIDIESDDDNEVELPAAQYPHDPLKTLKGTWSKSEFCDELPAKQWPFSPFAVDILGDRLPVRQYPFNPLKCPGVMPPRQYPHNPFLKEEERLLTILESTDGSPEQRIAAMQRVVSFAQHEHPGMVDMFVAPFCKQIKDVNTDVSVEACFAIYQLCQSVESVALLPYVKLALDSCYRALGSSDILTCQSAKCIVEAVAALPDDSNHTVTNALLEGTSHQNHFIREFLTDLVLERNSNQELNVPLNELPKLDKLIRKSEEKKEKNDMMVSCVVQFGSSLQIISVAGGLEGTSLAVKEIIAESKGLEVRHLRASRAGVPLQDHDLINCSDFVTIHVARCA